MSDKDQMSDKDKDEEEEEDERVLDKEEKEMDEGDNDDNDDEDSQMLARDADIMEEAMEEEIEGAVRKVKPVCKVLFKVSLLLIYVTFLFFSCRSCNRCDSPSSFFFFLFLPYIYYRSNPICFPLSMEMLVAFPSLFFYFYLYFMPVL